MQEKEDSDKLSINTGESSKSELSPSNTEQNNIIINVQKMKKILKLLQ